MSRRFSKKSRTLNKTKPAYHLHLQATSVQFPNPEGGLTKSGFCVWCCTYASTLEDAFHAVIDRLMAEKDLTGDLYNDPNDPIEFWLVEHEVVYLEPGYILEGTGYVFYTGDEQESESGKTNIEEEVEEVDPSGLHVAVSFSRSDLEN